VVASGQVESILKNVSKTKTTGHEFELESVAVENLVIRAALSFMRADYSRYFVPSLIDPTSQVSFADLAVPLAPVKMFKLTGLYTLPYGDGHFRFYGGYRFTTEYWSNPTVPAGRVHNFAMIDLSADYLRNDWTFRLFLRNHNDIRNLTNVRSPTDAELVSLPPGITAPLHLLTVAEPSQPKVLGLEIIFTP
jgi:outer membrane receptor for ferric coprogen and ferric-rhodotorulic acid